ncbi:MAG: HAMP domain-containing histidine kinase [Candidatus Omnitrophica bacterium]|nr:HAMP domain-containing histidine kinase [Candidatus Omnitrophota bacterium]
MIDAGRWPPPFRIVFGTFLIVALAAIDLWTGFELSFSVFYLLPVSFFSWYSSRRAGLLSCAICAGLWLASDLYAGHAYSHPVYPVWNSLIRLAIFLTAAILLTELKKEIERERMMNLKLARAVEDIEKLSRVKSEFTAMVSHEIRTPLTAIRESVNILRDSLGPGLQEDHKTYLEITQRNVDRLSRLLNDVLDFAKLNSGKRQYRMVSSSLNDTIQETATMFRQLAGNKGLSLETELGADLPAVWMDRDAIIQVLTNLIQNAIKFTERGGILIRSGPGKDGVEVEVRDTGRGMKAGDLERIFLPFERSGAANSVEGTGLGLAIAKRILEHHGGKIWAASAPGKGSSLFFSLPSARREEAPWTRP